MRFNTKLNRSLYVEDAVSQGEIEFSIWRGDNQRCVLWLDLDECEKLIEHLTALSEEAEASK